MKRTITPIKCLLFNGVNVMFFLLLTYPIAVFVSLIVCLLRLLGIIKISHWERFPKRQGKLIVASNHPSLLEPTLLPALFLRDFLFHPFQYIPWSTPDKNNYSSKFILWWLKPRMIPVDRESKKEGLRTLHKIKDVLNQEGVVILFPEGGRTYRGEKFIYSQKGKQIRKLKDSMAWLVIQTGATILPIWIEGSDKFLPNTDKGLYSTLPRFWKTVTIKIGELIKFNGQDDQKELTEKITEQLLNLADE